MGCGESKIKSINLSPANSNEDPSAMGGQPQIEMTKTVEKMEMSPRKIEPSAIEDHLPNRLLSAIPISDLGESLDSRHLSESFSHNLMKSHKLDSAESNDSGYDEYEEDYSHIITESSDPDLVRKVEQDFRAVDLPELLVITGRACTRILSGYQKSKAEEAKILDTLRHEGLLAKPKGKTGGGVSFEVVDAELIEKKQIDDSDKDVFVTADFIPSKTLKRLELRRGTIKRPNIKLEAKLAEAELRRKELEEEKVKTVLERSGLERHGRLRTASAMRREQNFSATVAKRQQQLQEMRDRLKEKHKKNDMIKLRKQLQLGSSHNSLSLENGFKMEGILAGVTMNNHDFFDD